jgi:hypothetical protein
MAWRGFLAESKSYIGYPHCGRLRFWSEFPGAWARFWWYTTRDNVLRTANRISSLAVRK